MSTSLNPVSTNAIISEEELSFKYNSFNDILLTLDTKIVELNALLHKDIDKKWIASDKEIVTEYIQDIINKIDVLINIPATAEEKFRIQSDLTGGQEKTLLQILTILVKEVDAIKKRLNTTTSSLYTPNV